MDNNTKTINFQNVNRKLLIINGLLLISFFAAQVIITSQYGTKTQEIDATRTEKDSVRQDNKYIESEIDKAKTFAAAKTVIDKYQLVQKSTTFVDNPNLDGLALQVK